MNDLDKELEQEETPVAERAPAVEAAAAPPEPPPAPIAQPPIVSDYIKDRLAKNDAELRQAQEQARDQKLFANIAEGVGQVTAGLARQKEFDPKSYQYLHENAKAPIEDYATKRQNESAALKGLADRNALQRQLELQNPNSRQSQIARVIAQRQLHNLSPNDPTKGEWLAPLNSMSAEDMKYLEKPIDQLEATASREQIAALKAKEIAATHALAAQERQARAETARAEKQKAEQDRQYKNLRHDLETFRGNQAVQQAATGVLSANKALDIVKGKDPNSLTRQDLQLLADELGKVATGGVPTEHGVQALLPNNLQSKIAELKNFVTSNPTDAQAGEYIKHNLGYLNAMKDTSQQALAHYRRNIAKGYKHLVRPEDLQEASDDYGLAGAGPEPASTAAQIPSPPAPAGADKAGIEAEMRKRGLLK